MDYKKVYEQLIQKARERGLNKKGLNGYYEKHHIIPRCLGGTNDLENLVLLTTREHHLAHNLLCSIHPNNHKLLTAFMLMGNGSAWGNRAGLRTSGRVYEKIRINFVQAIIACNKTRKMSDRTRMILRNYRLGRPLSLETKEKLRKIFTGRVISKEQREHTSRVHKGKTISESQRKAQSECMKGNKYNLGRKASEETKAKMRAAHAKKLHCYIGNKHFLGRKHSEETKAKMRKPKARRSNCSVA